MAARVFRFGPYVLDAARRELRLGGQPVDLPARAIQCIIYLIDHRDRAVARDELIGAVWRNADISNNVLDQTMMRARRALGDVSDERRTIRTVHGFGYAWDVPVEVVEADALDGSATVPASSAPRLPDVPVEPVEPVDPPEAHADATATAVPDANAVIAPDGSSSTPARVANRMWWLPTVMIAVVVLAAAAVVVVWRSSRITASEKLTTVVLPVSVTPGESQAWMRLGLMDAIAERLRMTGHSVMPVDNVIAVTGGVVNPSEEQVAALTGAGTARMLVRPAVERIDDHRWRVSLDVRRGAAFVTGEVGEAADVLTAARIAADRLSAALGATPLSNSGEPPETLALQQALQIADAARLDSRIDDARALLDMLTPAQQSDPEAALMRGFVDVADGEFENARVVFERLLSEKTLQYSSFVQARALYGKGVSLFHLSQVPQSIATLDQSVAMLEHDGSRADGDWLGRILSARAIAYVLNDQPQPALADHARARMLFEDVGDTVRLSVLDNNIGWVSLQRNRFRDALPTFERAAASSAALNTVSVELRARIGIVRAHLALLEPERALEEDARIADLAARSPGATVKHLATGWRIRALMANGRLSAADRLIKTLSEGEDRSDEEQFVPWGIGLGAQRAFADGRFDKAAALAALSIARGWGANYDPREYAWTMLVLQRAQLALGKRDEAAATANSMLQWVLPDRLSASPAIYIAVSTAEAQAAGLEEGSPEATFDHALELADANQTPLDLLEVCRSYAGYLIAKGNLARATQVVGRVGEWSSRHYEVAALEARLAHAMGHASQEKAAVERANALAGERPALTFGDAASSSLATGRPGSDGRAIQPQR